MPIGSKIIVLEASNDRTWNEFVYNSKYIININKFGVSGKKADVLKYLEFDKETLLMKIENLLK